MKEKPCAYCGEVITKQSDNHRDHVFPDCLYASADPKSTIQRMIVDCCKKCNSSWQDDEVQFRNMLTLAGDQPTQERQQLWNSTIKRSFQKKDGMRRTLDMLNEMKPVVVNGQPRYEVYPARDDRVMRVVTKIVRGLSHFHNIRTAVPEALVWADILPYPFPSDIAEEMQYCHRDPNIVEYRYMKIDFEGISSAWLITFFKRISFVAKVNIE